MLFALSSLGGRDDVVGCGQSAKVIRILTRAAAVRLGEAAHLHPATENGPESDIRDAVALPLPASRNCHLTFTNIWSKSFYFAHFPRNFGILAVCG